MNTNEICSCFLCEKNRFRLNAEAGLPTYDSIVYEDNNIYVAPDLAPIAVGHFLIVSKRHINSYGNSNFDTFMSICNAERFIIQECYNNTPCVLFEHGAVIPNTAGASIDHAHLHSIPDTGIIVDNLLALSGISFPEKVRASVQVLSKYAEMGQPYVFYRDATGAWVRPVGTLPHQFFRFLLSGNYDNVSDWTKRYCDKQSSDLFMQTLKLKKPLRHERI